MVRCCGQTSMAWIGAFGFVAAGFVVRKIAEG
jgi:hypothetical protein